MDIQPAYLAGRGTMAGLDASREPLEELNDALQRVLEWFQNLGVGRTAYLDRGRRGPVGATNLGCPPRVGEVLEVLTRGQDGSSSLPWSRHPDGRGRPDGGAGASRSLYERRQERGRGRQAVLDLNTFQIVFVSNGLQRIDQGLVNLQTGEGSPGLIGFGWIAMASPMTAFITGPTFAIPEQAQTNGAACHGIVSIEAFFTKCWPDGVGSQERSSKRSSRAVRRSRSAIARGPSRTCRS